MGDSWGACPGRVAAVGPRLDEPVPATPQLGLDYRKRRLNDERKDNSGFRESWGQMACRQASSDRLGMRHSRRGGGGGVRPLDRVYMGFKCRPAVGTLHPPPPGNGKRHRDCQTRKEPLAGFRMSCHVCAWVWKAKKDMGSFRDSLPLPPTLNPSVNLTSDSLLSDQSALYIWNSLDHK